MTVGAIIEKLREIQEEFRGHPCYTDETSYYQDGYSIGQQEAADRIDDLIEEIKSYFVYIEE